MAKKLKLSMDPKWFTLIVAAIGLSSALLGGYLTRRAAWTQQVVTLQVEERRESVEFLEQFSLIVGKRSYAASDLHFAVWWQKSEEEVAVAEKAFLETRKEMLIRNAIFISTFKVKFHESLKEQFIHLDSQFAELDELLADLKTSRTESKAARALQIIDEIGVEHGFIIGRAMKILEGGEIESIQMRPSEDSKIKTE